MFLLFVENPNLALNNERERLPFYGPFFYDHVSDFFFTKNLIYDGRTCFFFLKSVFVMF